MKQTTWLQKVILTHIAYGKRTCDALTESLNFERGVSAGFVPCPRLIQIRHAQSSALRGSAASPWTGTDQRKQSPQHLRGRQSPWGVLHRQVAVEQYLNHSSQRSTK